VIIGLDTNILCYTLDPAYPEHKKVKDLLLTLSSENIIALNPTILHEAYHTLVYYLQWTPQEATKRLTALLKHPFILFFNQTRKTSLIALNLSTKYDVDGRDSLIVANFIANKIPTIYTHDKALLKLQKIAWKKTCLNFKDPLLENIL
jgi:predicted nucleic acid-binding protein